MPSTAPRALVVPRSRRLALVAGALVALGTPVWVAPLADASTTVAPAPDHAAAWGWPVEGSTFAAPRVLRGFDPPDQPWLAGHRGVDLQADPFSLVRSAGAGVVVFAGLLAGRGVISVDHPSGLRTTYEPVDALVEVGEPVALGTVLGLLEVLTTHCLESCLHWGLREGNVYLDPLSLISRPPPVLLPYGPPVVRSLPDLCWSWWL